VGITDGCHEGKTVGRTVGLKVVGELVDINGKKVGLRDGECVESDG